MLIRDARFDGRTSRWFSTSAMLTFVLATTWLVGTVGAQPAEAGEPVAPWGEIDPASIYGRDNNQSVYVADSAVVIERIALAERMERLQEWAKSAEIYQGIIEEHADKVLPSQIDRDNRIYQYASVSAAIQTRLSRWPEVGRRVYLDRYEPHAAELLAEALPANMPQLHQVFSQYFVTQSARDAGMQLVGLYLESGDFSAAAWIASRLLGEHPLLSVEQNALLRFQLAVALHLAGDTEAARKQAGQLHREHPGVRAVIAGEEVVLDEVLPKLLERGQASSSTSLASDSWNTVFGSPDRSRIPPDGARAMVRTAIVELRPSIPSGLRSESIRQFQRLRSGAAQRGQLNGILPVADNGELFFQDNARVYAVNLSTGLPLPGWAATYGGDAAGTFAIEAHFVPASVQLAVALTDSEVFAVLGQTDPISMQVGMANTKTGSQLVALDRRSGKKLWSVTMRALKVPQGQSRLRDLQWVGTPLVVGDNLYVLARGGGVGRQFDESHLVCLRRSDGAFVWGTFLVSTGSNTPMWGGQDMFGRSASSSQLAYSSGRVYVLTNLGGLAAVDAFDGSIAFLNVYPQTVQQTNPRMADRPGVVNTSNGKPFTHNPVIVSNGRVFVLPSDGDHLVVYDAGSGVEINRLRMSHFGNAHTLLGVVGDTVILAGNQLVFAVDWKKYDPTRYNPAAFDESLRWKSATIARPNAPSSDTIRGRGFVTEKAVYVPTIWDLRRFSLAMGRLESTYPAEGSWDEDETTGNVLVLPEHLVIAGASRVCIYTDPSIIRARLAEDEKARPNDAEPRVRTAEVMFVAGDRDGALAKLDEAIALAGGPEDIRSGPARERVFSAAITFARKLLSDPQTIKSQKHRQDWTSSYLARAALSAQTAGQQVEQRLLRARLAELIGDVPGEMALHQQILDDPELRAVGVGNSTAADVAERAIDRLIKRAGRSIYEQVESRAGEALRAAMSTSDVESLVEVAEQYPNSRACIEASLAAARLLEAADQPLAAALLLRKTLTREIDDRLRARVHESMARNYLRLPNRREMAIAQLRLAARLAGGESLSAPLVLDDGGQIEGMTLAQALKTVQASRVASVEQSLPDFNLTVVTAANRDQVRHAEPFGPASSQVVLESVEALAVPLPGTERHDRLVVWSKNSLRVLSAETLKPVCELSGVTASPIGCGWQDDTLVFWTRQEVFCVDASSGTIRWQTSLKDLGGLHLLGEDLASGEADDEVPAALNVQMIRRVPVALVPNAGQNPPEQIVHFRLLSDRVVFGTSLGRLACLNLRGGSVAWQNRLGFSVAQVIESTDDFVVGLQREDFRLASLVALNATTGRVVYRHTLAQTNGIGIANFALGADGMLVYVTPDRLIGKDLHDPSEQPTFQTDRSASEGVVFLNTVMRGQLVIADGRVLVWSFAGTQQQAVRAYSLADGKPMKFVDPKTKKETPVRFNPEAGTSPGTIRVVGNRLYLVGQRNLVCYDIETGVKQWARHVNNRKGAWSCRDVLVGRDYLIAIDEVGVNGAKLELNCFNRTRLPDGMESGTYDYVTQLETPGGFVIGQWQPISGGLAVRTQKNKLIVLRGQRSK